MHCVLWQIQYIALFLSFNTMASFPEVEGNTNSYIYLRDLFITVNVCTIMHHQVHLELKYEGF